MDKIQQSGHHFDQHRSQEVYFQRFRKHSLAPLEYLVDINASNAGGSCTLSDPTSSSGPEWIDDPNFKLPEIHFDEVSEMKAVTSENPSSVGPYVIQPKEEYGVLVEGAEMSALLPPQTVLEDVPVESWVFDSMELSSCYPQQTLPGPQESSTSDDPMIQHSQAHFHQHHQTTFDSQQTHEEVFLPSFHHPQQQNQHLHTSLPPLALQLTPHHGHQQNQIQLQPQRHGVLIGGVGGYLCPTHAHRYPEQEEYHVGEFVLSHRPSMDACELFGPFMASNPQGPTTLSTIKSVPAPTSVAISAPVYSPPSNKGELPMVSSLTSSSSHYQAELRILTTLNDRYWKNGRKNLQCFPTCPEHNDFFSMKMNNRKHSSVGVCRGPVYCQLITEGIYNIVVSSSTPTSSKSASTNYRLPQGVELYVLGRFERVPQRNDTKMVDHLTPPPKEFTNAQEFECFRSNCFQAVEMEERRSTTTTICNPNSTTNSSVIQEHFHKRPQIENSKKIQSTWFFLPDVWKVQPMLKKKRKATRSAPAQTFPFCFRTFVYVRRPCEDNKVVYQCLSIDTSSFFELYSTRTVDRVKRKYWQPT
jgi:hypothetical protein